MITREMQAFTFGGTPGGSSTSEKRFLSLSRFALKFVSYSSMHHRQSSSEDIRYLTAVITTATLWDTITNNHIPLAALQHLLTFFSLQTSTSILASNGDSYSLQRYFPQPRSYINFVYFQPLTRFPILTFLPSTTVFSFLVWAISVEPRRVRGVIVEGNSVVL